MHKVDYLIREWLDQANLKQFLQDVLWNNSFISILPFVKNQWLRMSADAFQVGANSNWFLGTLIDWVKEIRKQKRSKLLWLK